MTAAWQALPSVLVRTCMSSNGIIGEVAAGDDVGTHGMTASPPAPRMRPARCTCLFAVRTWLYLKARACLPVGVPVGLLPTLRPRQEASSAVPSSGSSRIDDVPRRAPVPRVVMPVNGLLRRRARYHRR